MMKLGFCFLVFWTWCDRFMTRPDVKQKYLGDFLDWSLTTLSRTDDKSITDTMVLDGVLQALVNTHIKTLITWTLQLILLYLTYGLNLPNHIVRSNRSVAHILKLNSVSVIGIIILPRWIVHKLVRLRNSVLHWSRGNFINSSSGIMESLSCSLYCITLY